MHLQLQLSLSYTQTHTHIILTAAVINKSWRNVATLWHFALPLLLLLRKVAATHHFVVTLCLHRYSCTFLHRGNIPVQECAHLHLIHVHTSPAKMCTLDNILLHDEHIALHFTHEKFFARDPRRIPRTKRCTSHSEDMNTVVFECHAQHISGSFAWFHNNAISSMTLLLAASSLGFALLQLIRLYCTACIKMHTAVPCILLHCCFLHVCRHPACSLAPSRELAVA